MRHNRRVRDPSPRPGTAVPVLPLAQIGVAGYDCHQVDALLARVGTALGQDTGPCTLAEAEVAHARFRVRRLRRGYQMQAVDDRLDQLQAEVARRRPTAGEDARGDSPLETSEHRPVRTWWIYAVAGLLALLIVGFLVTQM